MIRHMALLDLIGIKKMLKNDWASAEVIVQRFWTRCKGSGLWGDSTIVEKWVAFTDSLLLSSTPNTKFGKFYDVTRKVLNNLCDTVHDSYLVLSSGDQIEPGIDHQILGQKMSGGSIEPTYAFIAGVGDAFASLFTVDAEARRLIKDPAMKNARIYLPASLDSLETPVLGSFRIRTLDDSEIEYNAKARY